MQIPTTNLSHQIVRAVDDEPVNKGHDWIKIQEEELGSPFSDIFV